MHSQKNFPETKYYNRVSIRSTSFSGRFSSQTFRFSDNNQYRKVDIMDIQSHRDDDGLYNVEAQRKVQISAMICPTTIRCTLYLLEINYTRRVETIFYGKFLISGIRKTEFLICKNFQILIHQLVVLMRFVTLLNVLIGCSWNVNAVTIFRWTIYFNS